jgi:hypothetical protein
VGDRPRTLARRSLREPLWTSAGGVGPSTHWAEIEAALSRELEHLERHVEEGDDDPFEATYAICNGSRILYAVDTGDVAVSKRSGGVWALEHVPERWHEAIRAAGRAYDGEARPRDEQVLRQTVAPFVAMVRQHSSSGRSARSGRTPPMEWLLNESHRDSIAVLAEPRSRRHASTEDRTVGDLSRRWPELH